jgi:AcrR family transcriptional regulator
MELQQRVLNKADELFRTYGIRSVTMDDIAKALGISKKTLYQSYSDKDLLIQETVEMTISNHYKGILSCKGIAAENAIHEQFAINELLGKMMHGINPIMFYDLQKYYPSIWNKFSDEQKIKLQEAFDLLLREMWAKADFLDQEYSQCISGKLACPGKRFYKLTEIKPSKQDYKTLHNLFSKISLDGL